MSENKYPHGESKSPKGENQQKSDLVGQFGARLRQVATAQGFNQTRLATALALPLSSMGRYWNGERLLPADLLFRAADCLSVEARWLLTGDDEGWAEDRLTAVEQKLLTGFRMLSDNHRLHIVQSVALLVDDSGIGAQRAVLAEQTLHSPKSDYRGPPESDHN